MLRKIEKVVSVMLVLAIAISVVPMGSFSKVEARGVSEVLDQSEMKEITGTGGGDGDSDDGDDYDDDYSSFDNPGAGSSQVDWVEFDEVNMEEIFASTCYRVSYPTAIGEVRKYDTLYTIANEDDSDNEEGRSLDPKLHLEEVITKTQGMEVGGSFVVNSDVVDELNLSYNYEKTTGVSNGLELGSDDMVEPGRIGWFAVTKDYKFEKGIARTFDEDYDVVNTDPYKDEDDWQYHDPLVADETYYVEEIKHAFVDYIEENLDEVSGSYTNYLERRPKLINNIKSYNWDTGEDGYINDLYWDEEIEDDEIEWNRKIPLKRDDAALNWEDAEIDSVHY